MKQPKQIIWMLAIGIVAAISGCSHTPPRLSRLKQ